ncbi:MAG: TIGR03084 family protein [Deltaproteobacteria bacterium]|nr:TIGR03084 family protein [Deltaproteobacteria bacterium]MBW2419434.1 TIGR03084 family protein [Deltaproteobacteria bacterium]
MLQVSLDLKAEADDFHAFLLTLQSGDWTRPTLFKDWTPWDVVAHLHFFDRVSLVALEGREAFAAERKRLIGDLKVGRSAADVHRRDLGELDPKALLDTWLQSCHAMADQLGASDPKCRLPWFGPDMGVSMFTTARYMETWAHAQAVYDLMNVERSHTDRIKNIAVIGVKTYGWTFVNRGLEVPAPPPYLRLVAPSGEIWEWNEPSGSESIRGDAVDFCQTVTQVRNVADTALEVEGEVATQWMSIAQCFAGGAEDPPKAGVRTGG